MKENWRELGNVRITVRDLDGNILEQVIRKNLLTTAGFNMMRDGLFGDVTDLEIKALTVGDDATAPALTDVVLGNETFRKAFTSHSKPANHQIRVITYIAPGEAIGVIEELGWVAGAAVNVASPAGKDTGIMVSRILYSRVKTALESIQVERLDTFSEG